jgi:predicted transposase YdaD
MGMEQQVIRDVYPFLDWVMTLPDPLEAKFWEELKAFEESQRMTSVTNAARIEYQRGRQEGKQEGEQDPILRQLTRKIGEVSEDLRSQVQALPLKQLEPLSEALLDFTQPSDLEAWLSKKPEQT